MPMIPRITAAVSNPMTTHDPRAIFIRESVAGSKRKKSQRETRAKKGRTEEGRLSVRPGGGGNETCRDAASVPACIAYLLLDFQFSNCFIARFFFRLYLHSRLASIAKNVPAGKRFQNNFSKRQRP